MISYCLCLLLLASSAAALEKIQINPQTGQFHAADGSVRIFHGLNMVDKGHSLIKISDEQMDIIKEWGMNFVRVGFLWNLVEPKPGVYNQTYLNELEVLVQRLSSKGLYSMLDMHQDLWSPDLCGQGIPNFYAEPYNNKDYMGGKYAFPQPIAKPSKTTTRPGHFNNNHKENCHNSHQGFLGWASGYLTHALSAASQRLYDNEGGYLTKFGDFWQEIAQRFQHADGVLGYELINEPWLGSVPLSFRELFGKFWNLWYPGVAESRNLHKMNQYLHKRIRDIDDRTIIFYEPSSGGNIAGMFPVGFPSGPGGSTYNDRQALSYHVYCPLIQTDIPLQPGGSGFGTWLKKKLAKMTCNLMNKLQYTIRKNDVKKLGGGGIMTEFGAIPSNADGIAVINQAMNSMDEFLHGWAYWYITPSKQADTKVVNAITRTYAQSISGEVKSMSFDSSSKKFELKYKPTEKLLNTATKIYASSKLHYASGLKCTVQPSHLAHCTYDASKNLASVSHSANANGKTITVLIERK